MLGQREELMSTRGHQITWRDAQVAARVRCLFMAAPSVGRGCDRPHMPSMPGCETPIRSITDVTMWRTALLRSDTPALGARGLLVGASGSVPGHLLSPRLRIGSGSCASLTELTCTAEA